MQTVPRSLSSHVVSCLFANFNSIGARFGPANPASTKTIPLQSSPSRTLRSCSSNTNLNIESKIVSKTLQQNEKMENKPDQQRKEHRSSNSTTTATINSNPDVNRMQEILRSDSSDGWEKCWDQGLTPWDLGQPTPVMVHLHQTGALPKGRALVPGCGSGHDVVAIACPERYVVGVDKSDKAIMKAIELSSSLQNADYFTFLKADIFTWKPTELFDLIFDYTFFCAIEPDMRSAWASQMQYLLKPDGELITLMFPISDHVGGPPYKVSITDYEEVLHPMGFKAASIVENDLAIKPRKGREKLGRWKKFTRQLSL